MRRAYVETLTRLAAQDSRITLMTADLGYTVFEDFAARFPKQFVNVGVAEANMVSVAAGLAMVDRIVFAYSIGTFASMRCLEQFRTDVCLHHLPVIVAGAGGGFGYGKAGPTHHSLEDMGIIRALPGSSVWAPCDALETQQIIEHLATHPAPAYVRIGKVGEPAVSMPDAERRKPIGEGRLLSAGKDAVVVSAGILTFGVAQAVELLRQRGIAASHIHLPALKPLRDDIIERTIAANGAKRVFSIEEHNIYGGLGSLVAERIAGAGLGAKLLAMGVPDRFDPFVGERDELLEHFGLSSAAIAEAIAGSLNE